MNVRNCFIQEMVRAFYSGWYRELVTDLPPIERGMIRPPAAPGHGLKLIPDILRRSGCHVRRSP